jgi:hypothetical protein
MRLMLGCLLAFVILIVVAPSAQMAAPATPAAPADSNEVVQVYQCSLGEGVTEVMLETAVKDWLKALRMLDGGEGIKIQILWPVAAKMGDKDFQTVLTYPSFTAFGRSWAAYNDDTLAAQWETLQGKNWYCPDSALWEGVTIEPSK